jgi:hypothetical protein
MLVLTPRWAQGAVVVALAAFGACSDPELSTDLRPAGPPEVLSVLVMDDYDAGLYETATFCKPGDTKRPGQVGRPDFTTTNVCDVDDLNKGADEVVAAVPTAWYARIMFDELLNPDIEELVPNIDMSTGQPDGTFTGTIENTQPITLTCGGVNVAYSGYYNPAGNNVTWPLGPSLFIQAVDLSTVPTGSECSLMIKDIVVDKDGEKVPADQRGPYKWKIDTLQMFGQTPAAADPGDEPTIVAAAPLTLSFNAVIDPTSLKADQINILEKACAAATCDPTDCASTTGATAIAASAIVVGPNADGDPLSLDISITGGAAGDAWKKNKAYTVSFKDTNVIKDVAGGTSALPGAADFTECFTTK